MEDRDQDWKEDRKINPLMLLKEDPAVTDAGDLTVEADWQEEGLPIAETSKITGMEVLLSDVTFSGPNLSTDRPNRKNINEKSNHRFNRYQGNSIKQQRSGI